MSGHVSYDRYALGALDSAGTLQSMQLIETNRLDGFSVEANYDAIMGLGVSGDVTHAGLGVASSSLKTLGVDAFGICFGSQSKEGGRFDVGSGIPGLEYTDVQVTLT